MHALLSLLLLAGVGAAPQRDFSKVEVKASHVAGSVHLLTGSGGNIGVSVGPDGILIVDDQFAPLAEKIRAALKTLGEGKLKFVLNTHWHGDHTGGNEAFGREAPILAHENVRKRLEAGGTVGGRAVEAAAKGALPVVTFEEGLSVHFNGEEIRMIHAPRGHTDGDSVVHFTGANVVHMGDLFFAGGFPFVDLDSGGDVEGLAADVEAVLAKVPADAKVIPGHGALATTADLRAYHGMLVETIGIVRAGMRAGKGLEEIRKEGLPEKWKSWGEGFISTDRWIETVHRSLSRGAGAAGAR